jgi:steroid delta-isomerase-like uncharacterized protein
MSNNRELAERFYEEVMNNGNLAFIDEFCSPDYIEHDDDAPSPDREGLKKHVAMIRQGFPDLNVRVEDILVDGDRVAARTKVTGTHEGTFAGLPPTNKQVAIDGMDLVRVVDGKLVEHWGLMDAMEMMQQLGVLRGHD